VKEAFDEGSEIFYAQQVVRERDMPDPQPAGDEQR
jgi:hypothetical protein